MLSRGGVEATRAVIRTIDDVSVTERDLAEEHDGRAVRIAVRVVSTLRRFVYKAQKEWSVCKMRV